jgi:hypothetical protein
MSKAGSGDCRHMSIDDDEELDKAVEQLPTEESQSESEGL